jgi:hypothetical protein
MSVRSHDGKLFLDDFVSLKGQDCYIHIPTGKVYTGREIDHMFSPVPVLTDETEGETRQ